MRFGFPGFKTFLKVKLADRITNLVNTGGGINELKFVCYSREHIFQRNNFTSMKGYEMKFCSYLKLGEGWACVYIR